MGRERAVSAGDLLVPDTTPIPGRTTGDSFMSRRGTGAVTADPPGDHRHTSACADRGVATILWLSRLSHQRLWPNAGVPLPHPWITGLLGARPRAVTAPCAPPGEIASIVTVRAWDMRRGTRLALVASKQRSSSSCSPTI